MKTSKNYLKSDPEQVKASILRILSNAGSMHWRGIYSEIRKIYKRIALETFNSCIKDLLLNKLICKEDVKEKGKKVNYSLTNKGSQRVRLLPRIYEAQKISDRLNEETGRPGKAYLLLLLFRGRPEYTIKSEKKLMHFLSANICLGMTWYCEIREKKIKMANLELLQYMSIYRTFLFGRLKLLKIETLKRRESSTNFLYQGYQ